MVDRHVVKSVVLELGLQFEFISDPNHQIHQDEYSRDPDVVYLFEPGIPIDLCPDQGNFILPDRPCDAIMLFQNETRQLHWDRLTKRAIYKILMVLMEERECYSCFETTGQSTECPRCLSRFCNVCVLKGALKPGNHERILKGHFDMNWQCLKCNVWGHGDFRSIYYTVLNRKDEFYQFTKEQKKCLMFLRDIDPKFQQNSDFWKEMEKWRIYMESKQFSKGMTVEICGLQNVSWNGKKAVIARDRVLTDNAFEWPIQLVNGPKETTLVKQLNMKKIGGKFWRKKKRLEFVKKKVIIAEDPEEPDLDNLWDDDSD